MTKYILSKMSPIHNTSKNDKFTNCWFSLNSTLNLITKVLVDSDIIIYYPKPKSKKYIEKCLFFSHFNEF